MTVDEYRKAAKRSKADALADGFAASCRARRLPPFEREHVFAKELGRRWRFDFAWPEHHVAAEIEGLVMRPMFDKSGNRQVVTMGRHASPAGIVEDMRKYNSAIVLGWSVLRFDQKLIASGEALDTLVRVFAMKAGPPSLHVQAERLFEKHGITDELSFGSAEASNGR